MTLKGRVLSQVGPGHATVSEDIIKEIWMSLDEKHGPARRAEAILAIFAALFPPQMAYGHAWMLRRCCWPTS